LTPCTDEDDEYQPRACVNEFMGSRVPILPNDVERLIQGASYVDTTLLPSISAHRCGGASPAAPAEVPQWQYYSHDVQVVTSNAVAPRQGSP
jgi:hypothetical protein